MRFWISLIGYQVVWFSAVIGAGHGLLWPGALAFVIYATWQVTTSGKGKADLLLMVAAAGLAMVLDGGLSHTGLLRYVGTTSLASVPPLWIFVLWATFALTFTQSLKYLQTRLWLAVALGAIGGPLAYLGAARGWQVVQFAPPQWPAGLWLAAGWGLATPLLAWLAARLTRGEPAVAGGLTERAS